MIDAVDSVIHSLNNQVKKNYSKAPAAKGRYAEPHTLIEPMHSFSHGHHCQQNNTCGRVRTYNDENITQHGAHTGQPMQCSLQYACNLVLEIHFIVKWQLSKLGICWPVSHDHIPGSSVELIQVVCFFKVDCWSGYGLPLDCRLKYLHKLLQQANNLELCY